LFRCPELAQRPYLLFLGRIHPKKGVDILIQAYLQDKSSGETQLDLVIAGPGWDSAYGREMKRLIETSPRSTRGSRRIHAVDMLAGFSKWGALYDCEAFILPSHQENFGIAVVEALACNKPVLISNKVNIWREIAEDHACLVENDSLEGALQLLNLFSLNKLKPRNASEAERFRQCYLQRFTNAVAAKNLSNVIGNILRKNV
ncbi:MAG: glycosyltransferase, partial [bacterium]